jgi:hypothetical protein
VALLIRAMSISVTRSSSVRIWPVKQSLVSKHTTAPGSTSTTARRSGAKLQITWSRGMRSSTVASDAARVGPMEAMPPRIPVLGSADAAAERRMGGL